MRILSWDVGIKHLAYCIINSENEKFTIEKWRNIDLTDVDTHRCCALLKKAGSPQCSADACFFNGTKRLQRSHGPECRGSDRRPV